MHQRPHCGGEDITEKPIYNRQKLFENLSTPPPNLYYHLKETKYIPFTSKPIQNFSVNSMGLCWISNWTDKNLNYANIGTSTGDHKYLNLIKPSPVVNAIDLFKLLRQFDLAGLWLWLADDLNLTHCHSVQKWQRESLYGRRTRDYPLHFLTEAFFSYFNITMIIILGFRSIGWLNHKRLGNQNYAFIRFQHAWVITQGTTREIYANTSFLTLTLAILRIPWYALAVFMTPKPCSSILVGWCTRSRPRIAPTNHVSRCI